MDVMTKAATGRVSFRLSGTLIDLPLDASLIAAMEAAAGDRTLSEMIRDALAAAFKNPDDPLGAIDTRAKEDRRARSDVIRITLQDAYQPGLHGKPIYPSKRPRRRLI